MIGCETDGDCASGEKCCNGQCKIIECNNDADCGFGYYCINDGTCNAQCIEGCQSDANCASGQKCCDGYCKTPLCSKDSDCPTNYKCQSPGSCNAECVFALECTDTSDCLPGRECCNNICVPVECIVNGDCTFYKGGKAECDRPACGEGTCDYSCDKNQGYYYCDYDKYRYCSVDEKEIGPPGSEITCCPKRCRFDFKRWFWDWLCERFGICP